MVDTNMDKEGEKVHFLIPQAKKNQMMTNLQKVKEVEHVTNQMSNVIDAKKYGHYQNKCYTKMPNKLMKHENIVDIEQNLVLSCKANKLNDEHTNTWYLNARCNNHMCGKKGVFLTFG